MSEKQAVKLLDLSKIKDKTKNKEKKEKTKSLEKEKKEKKKSLEQEEEEEEEKQNNDKTKVVGKEEKEKKHKTKSVKKEENQPTLRKRKSYLKKDDNIVNVSYNQEEMAKFIKKVVIRSAIYISLIVLLIWFVYSVHSIIPKLYRDPYPMVRNLNSICINVDPTTILDDQYMNQEFDFTHLRYSMSHHMNEGLEGICALHLGVPLCYCMLKTVDNQWLYMFNTNITGSSELTVLNEEYSNFCPQDEFIAVERTEQVWITFHTEKGLKIKNIFDGFDAYNLQHLVDVSNGNSICDSNKQETIYNLYVTNYN